MSDIENEVFETENEQNKESLISNTSNGGGAAPAPAKRKKWSKRRSLIVLCILIFMITWLLVIGVGVGIGVPLLLLQNQTSDDLTHSNNSAFSGTDASSEFNVVVEESLFNDARDGEHAQSVQPVQSVTISTKSEVPYVNITENFSNISNNFLTFPNTNSTFVNVTKKNHDSFAATSVNTTPASKEQNTTTEIVWEDLNATVHTPLITTTKFMDTAKETSMGPSLDNTTLGPSLDNKTLGPRQDNTTLGPRQDNATLGPRQDNTTLGPRQHNTTLGPMQESTNLGPTLGNTTLGSTPGNTTEDILTIKQANVSKITYKTVTTGAVASDHGKCSVVGRDVLASGGSAVDSAIATLLCNGILQPHSMGIGGGCFMVLYDQQSRQVDIINGREIAPRAATFDKFVNQSFLFGPLSVGIPGEIKAYWAAHQKYGKLPWKTLFTPTIKMAREGSPLSASAARGLRFIKKRLIRDYNTTLKESYPELCKVFCNKKGEILKKGAMVYRPKFAKTLEMIAKEGPDYLYKGKGAKKLVNDMKKFKAILTLQDLHNYELRKTPTLTYQYGNITMYTVGAPSGGPVMGLILKVLEGFNFTPEDLSTPEKEIQMYHKIIETFKFVYADRLKLGDPLFSDIGQLLEKMASPEYAEFLRSKIDVNGTHKASYYTNTTSEDWDSYGTTHISIIGPDGDAVAVTSSINYYFGSLLYSPSTGIIMNNEMADFKDAKGELLDNLKSQSANYIAPNKMPLSSMAPAVFVNKDGKVVLVLGSSGGARITTVNAQVVARILWLKQTVKEAIDHLRFHHQLFPNSIIFEQKFPKKMMETLHTKYGHNYTERTTYMAVVQGVARHLDTGEIEAFSDMRKYGRASLLQKNITVDVY